METEPLSEQADNRPEISVDEVFLYIGGFGRFQILLDALFCFISVPMSYQIILMYFLTINPHWSCVDGSTVCTFNGTFPNDDKRRCDMPRTEWKFTEDRDFSIVTEFEVYCGKEWILHLNSSILFAGWGLGAFFMGWVGNKYGRKTVLFPSILAILIVGFLSSFLQNLLLIIVSRLVIGFCIPGTMYCMFLLISELVSDQKRALASLLIWVMLPIAFSILALKGYFIQRWRTLSMACTAPYIPILFFYKFVPDSFKWQLSQGRREEAKKTIDRIAEWNKRRLPSHVRIERPKDDSTPSNNPFDIFMRTKKIACNSTLLSVIWLFLGMVYYGLYFAADDLGGSPYRDLFILSISEVPSTFLAIDLCNRFGRKPATLCPLLLAAISCLLIAILPLDGPGRMEKVIIGMLGKLFLATSFNSITTWSVEIFPVDICSGGIGFLQMSSRIGSGTAPWIAKCLKILSKDLPFIAMGMASLGGFVLGIWLPETKADKSFDIMNDLQKEEEENLINAVHESEAEAQSRKEDTLVSH